MYIDKEEIKRIKRAVKKVEEREEWDEPFCVRGDADLFHMSCGRKRYGKRVDRAISLEGDFWAQGYPLDDEGNPLAVVTCQEWIHETREALSHGEGLYDTCGHCLQRLYNKPRKPRS